MASQDQTNDRGKRNRNEQPMMRFQMAQPMPNFLPEHFLKLGSR
jgi:hypothetical protein